MKTETSAAIKALWEKITTTDDVTLGLIVREAVGLGVTRFRVDFVAGTATFYAEGGAESYPLPELDPPAATFDPTPIITAAEEARAGKAGNFRTFAPIALAAGGHRLRHLSHGREVDLLLGEGRLPRRCAARAALAGLRGLSSALGRLAQLHEACSYVVRVDLGPL